MRESFEYNLVRYVRRHLVETLLVLYVAPLLWFGLVPFDFGPLPPGAAPVATQWGLPVATTHLPDNLANVALFIPLGLLVRLALLRRRWGPVFSFAGTMSLAAVASNGLEWVQHFSSVRISSVADFGYNLIGAMVGALASSIVLLTADTITALGRSIWDRLADAAIHRPSAVLAQLCAAVLFLAAIMPFDVTFSADRLYQSLREAEFQPFKLDARLSRMVHAEQQSDRPQHAKYAARDRWQLHLDYAAVFAGYLALGALIARYLGRHCGLGGVRRALWTLTACGLLATAGVAARLFIMSRVVDVTDILFAVGGAVVGLAVSDSLAAKWQAAKASVAPQRRRVQLFAALLAVGVVYCVAREWAPFRVDSSPASIQAQLQGAEWLPFTIYQRARLPVALDDLLGKFVRIGALGFLWAVLSAIWGRRIRRYEVFAASVAAAAAMAVLEVGQILLPSRMPSCTDVLIACFACGAGVVAQRVIAAIMGDLLRPVAEVEPVRYDVTFGEDFPAPIEPAPTPQRRPVRPTTRNGDESGQGR